jgi:DNA-binding transcriptional LysR family regulator
MKRHLPIDRGQLDGILVFLRVAELRSFRAAASQLGISPSAVSQAVRTLEERMGVPLFVRTTRTVGLTDAGQRLLSHVSPAVDMLASGMEAAIGMKDEVSGLLRLSVPRALLPLLASRLLPDFCLAFPGVQLELFADDKLINIVEGGFDAGIRFGDLVEADMVAVRLTPPIRFTVVGTPGYFESRGFPEHPRDLQAHACIQIRMSTTGTLYNWDFVDGGQPVSVAVTGPLIVNDTDMILRGALTGLGLAYLPEAYAAFHIASGQLIPALQAFAPEEPGLMLYHPSRAQSLPKLRAFVEFARSRMRKEFQPGDYLMPSLGGTAGHLA